MICISDEAHRSQINLDQKVKITAEGVNRTYGFAKYLHDSLPNATYVGFTGTPIDATIEVFGGVVDAYTMTEAVRDGITVNLVYDGRAAKVGKDVHVLANDMKSFRAVIETSVGSVFYSWIFGFGGRVAIKSPEDVKVEYAEMVRTAAEALSE